MPVTADILRLSVVARSTINGFKLVATPGVEASSSNLAHFGKVLGITLLPTAIGFAAEVISAGLVTNPAWHWNYNDLLFLNSNQISATPPTTGFCQQIGIAINPTTIILELSEPILL